MYPSIRQLLSVTIEFMKKQNKKGFLLIEFIIACALLVSIAALMSLYFSAMAKQYCQAKRHLETFRLLQHALYEDGSAAAHNAGTIDAQEFMLPPLKAALRNKGYSNAFHQTLIIKVVSMPEDQDARLMRLESICVRRNAV